VGRVVAALTDEPVSAQTVSRLTRVLDREVEKFHRAPLPDDWAYLLLDGVWMKVRRVHQRRKRGANHLCDFSALQSAVAKPHPPPFYTSSLTSPVQVNKAMWIGYGITIICSVVRVG